MLPTILTLSISLQRMEIAGCFAAEGTARSGREPTIHIMQYASFTHFRQATKEASGEAPRDDRQAQRRVVPAPSGPAPPAS
jgi:hypothetical protein